jgi:hypothetical protein
MHKLSGRIIHIERKGACGTAYAALYALPNLFPSHDFSHPFREFGVTFGLIFYHMFVSHRNSSLSTVKVEKNWFLGIILEKIRFFSSF